MSNALKREQARQIVSVCGFLLVLMVFLAWLTQPQQARSANTMQVHSPVPFELHAVGNGFALLSQEGYRRIYFQPKAVQDFVIYEKGQGPADGFAHPVIVLQIGGRERRLDCADNLQVNAFVRFMLGSNRNEQPAD